MRNGSKLSLACGSALGLVMALSAAATPALAQDTAAEEEAVVTQDEESVSEVQEVIVVGSRIRGTYDSPSPIQVITREETTLQGYNSTTQALQGTAITGGSAQINNAYGGFVTNGGPGANTVGLRGLGPGRTLVLMNGRRVSPAGSRGSVGSADLNVLPTAMIDRIEVLRDGASSIYGSDAIAGVINIQTRKAFDGLYMEGQYNGTEDGGGEQSRISVVGGKSWDRLSISGSAEWYQREELTLGDRDWTRCNQDYRFNPDGSRRDYVDPITGDYKCYPITGTGSNGVTINTIGTPTRAGVAAPGAIGGSFNRWRPNSAVTTGVVGFEGVGGGLTTNLNVRDTFDPRMLNRSLISPVEIATVFVQGSYDLMALGDAELYAEVLGNRRESEITGYRQLSLDYAYGSPLIPANLQFPTAFSGPSAITNGQNVGIRAFIGFGNDLTQVEQDFFRGTVGLRGDFVLPEWRYDFYVSTARSDSTLTQQSWLTDRLAQSLDVVADGSGGFVCRDQSNGCIAAPALSTGVVGGILPQDWVDWTFVDVEGSTIYEETVASFIIDGPLFELPAGDIQGAFGLEYRTAEIDDTPSIHSQNGNLYNLTSSTPTRGTDDVWEVYGEVQVPILRDMAFADELSINASARYTEYDSYGGDTTYKLGVVYSPTDWLTFRSSYGTSFRAPALFEQFLGATSGFLSAAGDPCNDYGSDPGSIRAINCASEGLAPDFNATSSIRVLTAGGAAQGLEAETSDNFGFGVVFQPRFLPEWAGNFALAIDYYDIEINNGVSRVGASSILQLCYDDPEFRAGGSWCNFIDPRDPSSNQLTVHDAYTNIASQIVEGIDYNLRWTRPVGPGDIRVNVSVTQYLDQRNRLFSTDPWDEYNGTINNPEYTATADVTYSMANWKFRYGMEWIDSMDSHAYFGIPAGRASTYDFAVPSYTLHNASVQFTSDSDWSAIVGVRNLTDETPPWISQGAYNRVGNSPLYSGYDYVGRQFFVNISKKF